jgi:hypothetical protein
MIVNTQDHANAACWRFREAAWRHDHLQEVRTKKLLLAAATSGATPMADAGAERADLWPMYGLALQSGACATM